MIIKLCSHYRIKLRWNLLIFKEIKSLRENISIFVTGTIFQFKRIFYFLPGILLPTWNRYLLLFVFLMVSVGHQFQHLLSSQGLLVTLAEKFKIFVIFCIQGFKVYRYLLYECIQVLKILCFKLLKNVLVDQHTNLIKMWYIYITFKFVQPNCLLVLNELNEDSNNFLIDFSYDRIFALSLMNTRGRIYNFSCEFESDDIFCWYRQYFLK